MISVTDLRAGVVFEDEGGYFLVLSYEHVKMGRGSGNIRVKVHNLSSGANLEKSFITGARDEDVVLDRKKTQYLYRDNGKFHLMDIKTYEQFTVDEKMIGQMDRFLKEGMELALFMVDEVPLYIELPKMIEYKVVQTGGVDRGNTVGASYKDALLENNLTVKVPLFIKTGEVIRVDTRSGEYVERAKG